MTKLSEIRDGKNRKIQVRLNFADPMNKDCTWNDAWMVMGPGTLLGEVDEDTVCPIVYRIQMGIMGLIKQ